MNTDHIADTRKLLRTLDKNPALMTPDASEPAKRAALTLIETALVLWYDGHEALERAADYGGYGYAGSGGGEGHGKGGHSSPTERAALSNRTDDFTADGAELKALMSETQGQAKILARKVRLLLHTAPKESETAAHRCKVPGCDFPEDKEGYCSTDYQYVRRNGHMPSEAVMKARRQAREDRRLAGSTP